MLWMENVFAVSFFCWKGCGFHSALMLYQQLYGQLWHEQYHCNPDGLTSQLLLDACVSSCPLHQRQKEELVFIS